MNAPIQYAVSADRPLSAATAVAIADVARAAGKHLETLPEFQLEQPVRYYSIAELRRMGFTRGGVRRLLGDPDKVDAGVQVRGEMRIWSRYWYAGWRVREALGTAGFAAMRRLAEARRTAPARRREQFEQQFKHWRAAMPAACSGMFSLNRYAKYKRSCRRAHRDEIYELKNRFVELLYKADYCVGCWEHRVQLPDKTCWGCDGDGCERCGYTGVYQKGRELRFVCFRFNVEGEVYTWHQPMELVTFEAKLTEAPRDWDWTGEEKPVPLSRAKFARAKDLVRWVLEKAAE